MVATVMSIFCMYCKQHIKDVLVGNGQTEGSGICAECLEKQLNSL